MLHWIHPTLDIIRRPMITPSEELLLAAVDFDLEKVKVLVRQGERNEDAFLSDVDYDDNEEEIAREMLFELYEALILAGHHTPDGSNRRCVARVVFGCSPEHFERSLPLIRTCIDQDMLDWGSSLWAEERHKERLMEKGNDFSFGLAPYENYAQAAGFAARRGNLEGLKLLIEQLPVNTRANDECAPFFKRSRTPFEYAATHGQIACVEYLLNVMPEHEWRQLGDSPGFPIIPKVASHGQDDMIRWLVERGFDVNEINKKGLGGNALSAALEGKKPDTVKLLLDLGCDPNNLSKNQPSPLQLAIWHKNTEIIPLLIEAGADIHYCEASGMPPILMAGMIGVPEAVPLLIAAGARLDEMYKDGQTPLHWAAKNDRLDTFIALLKEGADMRIEDKDGQTAYMIAKPQVKAWLESNSMQAATPAGRAQRKLNRL